MHRILHTKKLIQDQTIEITDATEYHHAVDVLKLKENNKVEVFNGTGDIAKGIIIDISHRKIIINLVECLHFKCSSPEIILACAIPKRSKFEIIIEKSTELGVDRIIPLHTENTEVILKEERWRTKQKRYQAVALSAVRQSKRYYIPIIQAPMTLDKALSFVDNDNTQGFIPSLQEKSQSLLNALQNKISPDNKSIIFFIGPEGDFTTDEYLLASNKGCTAVTLGSKVLRVETAAITVMAVSNLFFTS